MKKKLLSRAAVSLLALSMATGTVACNSKKDEQDTKGGDTSVNEIKEGKKTEKESKETDSNKEKKDLEQVDEEPADDEAGHKTEAKSDNAKDENSKDREIAQMSVKSNYRIAYSANGGDSFNIYTETSDGYGNITTQYPTRKGYVFTGWNMKSDGSGNSVMPGQKVHIPGDITLFAQWKSGQYSIKYELNGGSNNIENPLSYNSGDYIYLKDAAKEGNTFLGWFTDPNFEMPFDATNDYASNLVLYAKWKTNKCAVQFLANGGLFNGYPDVSYSLVYGNKYKVPNPEKNGFRFKGWTIAGAGEIVEFTDEYSVLRIKGDGVLTALWESVTDDNAKLILSANNLSMIKGNSKKISCNYKNGITYETSNSAVATVSADGTITAVGKGNAVITVYFNKNGSDEKSAQCKVSVTESAVVSDETLILSESSLMLNAATSESIKLSAFYSSSTIEAEKLSWQTSNDRIVSVSNTGLVTAVNPGSATITVSDSKGKTATCRITVTNGEVTADSVVSLNKEELILGLKTSKKAKLRASANNVKISNTDVEWISSNPEIAKVNKYGDITAVSKGSTVISVRLSNGSIASCKVKVVETLTDKPLVIDKDSLLLDMTGETSAELDVTVNKAGYTSKSLKWTSSDEKVAKVNNSGVIKAIGNGTAQVKATLPDGTSVKCDVTVNTTATGILLDNKEISLTSGGGNTKKQLTASVIPSASNLNNKVVWASSDETVASVNSKGEVTANNPGSAVITAILPNGETTLCTVTVTAFESPIEFIDEKGNKVTAVNADLSEDLNTKTLKVRTKEDNSNVTANWFSSNEDVVTVSSSGELKFLKNGRAEITAMDSNGNTVVVNVVVYTTVKSIKITGPNVIDLNSENKTIVLKAGINPSTANVGQEVTWTSSDETIAIVDDNGNVVGLKEGTVEIKATSGNGLVSIHEVKVEKVKTTIKVEENLKIDLNSENKTAALNVIIENAKSDDDKILTFTSSDENIAKVNSDGVVSGINTGKCKIEVTTKSGITAECNISVVRTAKGIGFKEEQISMKVGESKKLSWNFTTLDVTERKVIFTSSDESIAIIEDDGTVKALGTGTAKITVTAENGTSADCIIVIS